MNAREKLQELEIKAVEFQDKQDELKKQVEEFEASENYEKYTSYTEDVVKETMYPKEHEIYKQIEDLETKIDAFYKEIIVSARELVNELDKSITELEARIEINNKYIEQLQTKMEETKKQIDTLKNTEAYKNGDEATILQVEELEEDLNSKLKRKANIEAKIQDIEKELESIKKEKEEIREYYGEEIDKLSQNAANQPPTKKEEQNQEKPNESANKKTTKGSKIVTGANVVGGETAFSVQPETENPQAKKDLKTEFNDLYSKAKSGKMTEQDFEKMVEIMKSPENYDNLGITTGIVFNKAKTIFKAMSKITEVKGLTAKNADEKLAVEIEKASKIVEVDRNTLSEDEQENWDKAKKHLQQCDALKETMEVYSNVSKKRMQQKWSWLFEFEEEKKPALNEAPKTAKATKPSLSDTLAEQTNEDPDYTRVSTNGRQKSSQEQIK